MESLSQTIHKLSPRKNTGIKTESTGAAPDAYRVLVGKREGTRPVGRPRCIWDGNTKMVLQKVEWGGMG